MASSLGGLLPLELFHSQTAAGLRLPFLLLLSDPNETRHCSTLPGLQYLDNKRLCCSDVNAMDHRRPLQGRDGKNGRLPHRMLPKDSARGGLRSKETGEARRPDDAVAESTGRPHYAAADWGPTYYMPQPGRRTAPLF
ncbi:hypothetical protein MUK42_37751 [Musa troglodytarum]|uniref:Uncharacterized protein n=1 Tax=Musa troglodytarum TaxID=320322 RepID=A0A9E7FDX7_9LILI|nr:hypothetical protein MUK42_37751 [Musa troglodytarum]